MSQRQRRALARFSAPAIAAGLMLLGPAPGRASSLPFTPTPNGFQAWLNEQRNWPHGQRLSFSGLAQCLDQTTRQSPYRTPVYTCLAGELRLSGGQRPEQRCQLQRVSYFPAMKRVRYWTAQCSPAG